MTGFNRSKAVVLVVEDEPLLRISAVDMIEEAGFEALQAGNAAQALRVLESRSDIAIILCDIHMPPGMNGIALITMVQARWPSVAIILVSGEVKPKDVEIPAGGLFLSKPYRNTEVVAALNRVAA